MRLRGIVCVPIATLAALSLVAPVLATNIPPGSDAFITPPGGAHVDFGDELLCQGGTLPPLPAGFFGPGSDPFDGVVLLVGVPLGGTAGSADTVVERLEVAVLPDPAPSSDTIAIELVQLSLHSVDPIVVTYNGGQTPTGFDVLVEESPSVPSPGTMTITQTQNAPDEGTFVSEMCVFVRATFTEVGNPGNQFVLDTGLTGDGVVVANPTTPAVWTVSAGDFRAPDGVEHTGPHPEVVSPSIPEIVPAGEDSFLTAYGQATYEFSGSPIPADFFAPGSEPFDGTIYFQGQPIDTVPPGALGRADTVVRRLADTPPLDLGDAATIPVQIVALRLVGQTPVGFGPGGIEHWPTEVCLSQSTAQPVGDMTITRTHDDGGRFTTNLPVIPVFRFTPPGGGPPLVLDCGGPEGVNVCDNLVITEIGAPLYWVFMGTGHVSPSEFPRTTFGAGIEIDGDCDSATPSEITQFGSTTFQAGLDPDGPNWKANTEAEDALNAGRGTHDSFLNTPEDQNNDGIPDRCEAPPDPHATVFPTRVTFGTDDVPALPADFFAPGSDPFIGTIFFSGSPLDPDVLGDTSTIVRRWYDPVLAEDADGTQGTVGIEIVSLDLVSTAPITVTFNGGVNPRQYDVAIGLSELARAPIGRLTATKTHPNGGTFELEFFVRPRFEFVPLGPGLPVILDTAAVLPPIRFQVPDPTPFVHAVSPGLEILTSPGARFVPGVEETVPGDPTSQQVVEMVARSEGGGVLHAVQPPTPPPSGPGVIPGTLTLSKTIFGGVRLHWTESCPGGNVDYGIHAGVIGAWYSHNAIDCTDDGADLQEDVPPSPESQYFLVVPHDDAGEGSYGRNSAGLQRPRGDLPCRPSQALGPCAPPAAP